MEIVFINQVASHLSKDIVNAFARDGKQVTLIAGSIADAGSPLDESIKVERVTDYNRRSIFSRQKSWVLATLQIIVKILIRYRGKHIVFTSNPPILAFVPLFCRNPYSIQILDIYPDALISEGFIASHSVISRIWERRNRKYFEKAKHIFTLTDSMAGTMSAYCDRSKISVIAQWPSISSFKKIERDKNEFIRQNGLENHFIVMYSGNIGIGHHVEILVELARLLMDQVDIKFLIVGEGWNKNKIRERIEELQIANCFLYPYQPAKMFLHSIQAADIGVVSVSDNLAPLCIPIKINNLIINEIPVLCMAGEDSELSKLVSKYNIGKCFQPDYLSEMAAFIIEMRDNPDQIYAYKENLKQCAKDFTPKNASKYVHEFNT